MTHKALIDIGVKWLKKHEQNLIVPNCSVVAKELTTAASNGERPDIIGWNSWASVLIEAKVSKTDFRKDKNKPFRRHPSKGMGNYRYFLCPEDLIETNMLPEGWGLLSILPEGDIRIVKESSIFMPDLSCERSMLYSIIRRQK